jgi:cytochrome c oxidase assembly factor CtaG
MPAVSVLLSLVFLLVVSPAFAHGGESDSIASWEWDIWIVAPLALSALLYVRGVRLIWRRAGWGRGIRIWQSLCFAAGWLTLFGALCSPLHWLGEHLFTAHMIEHELLMAVAAPLLAVSKPLGAFMRALPKPWRNQLTAGAQSRPVHFFWNGIMDPTAATVIHGVALWVWHAPAIFDATVTDEFLHRLQHVSFLVSALVFWWALIRRSRRDYGLGAVHIFATMVHMSLLGALIALSPRLLYRAQTAFAPQFGLTPLEDQQLAGLVMWVPAGTIYAGVALAMLLLWIAPPVPRHAAKFPRKAHVAIRNAGSNRRA